MSERRILTSTDKAAIDENIGKLSEEIENIKEEGLTTTTTHIGALINTEANEGDNIEVTAETTESVTLVHQGKNFAPEFPAWNSNGIVGTNNEDGTYTIKGTNTSSGSLYITPVPNTAPRIFPAGTYTASSTIVRNTGAYALNIASSTVGYLGSTSLDNPFTFTLNNPSEIFWYLDVLSGKTIDQTFYMQIENNTEPTVYEKHWRVTYEHTLPMVIGAKNGVNILYTESGDVLASNVTRTVYSDVVSLKKDMAKVKSDIASPLNGKTINVLGDSITSTNYTRPTWWELIADKTGASFNNHGVSATSIAVRADRTDSFVERAANLETDADAVIVMGGTNDSQITRGAWGSTDNTTFFGALNSLLSTLCEKFAGKPIFFCTPMQTANGLSDNTANPGATLIGKTDSDTLSMQLRAEAIKQKCAQYGVYCIDLYNGSGINGADTNKVYFISNDTLHPSDIGQKRLANIIHWEMEMFFGIE